MRSLNKIHSAFIALLLAVALFGSWSWLGNKQLESIASGNEFGSNVSAGVSTELRQNLTIKGDIVVENGTYLIENVNLNLTGTIIASNDATVIIRNATLFTTSYESVVLTDQSKLIAENSTIILNSTSSGDSSRMILGDETTLNMTDSEVYGYAFIIGRQNSEIYLNRSILKGPSPTYDQICGVITEDNSTARIQDSELDTVQAHGNSSIHINGSIIPTEGVSAGENALIEIENSEVGTAQWLFDDSSLRIINSTVDYISFKGSSLIVQDSQLTYGLRVEGNSTAWLTNASASFVVAVDNATVWLINSYSGTIYTQGQGKVNVGWQLPLFGILTVPHNWIPILQGIAVLAAIVVIIALLIVLNRRWKRRQQWKMKERALLSD